MKKLVSRNISLEQYKILCQKDKEFFNEAVEIAFNSFFADESRIFEEAAKCISHKWMSVVAPVSASNKLKAILELRAKFPDFSFFQAKSEILKHWNNNRIN